MTRPHAGLKAFGSATELADDLLAANRTRMKLRALVRLAVRVLLVPLSVVVAIWVVAHTYSGTAPMWGVFSSLADVARSMVPLLASVAIIVGLLAHPHLNAREARLVAIDGLGDGGFTDVETRATGRLKSEFKLAIQQAEKAGDLPQ